MAQALFDEHPLGEYLRDAGESPFSIPGISTELEREIDPNFGVEDDDREDVATTDGLPRVVVDILELLQSIFPAAHGSHPSSPFIERFKYHVISSSLLAPALPTGRSTRIPGNLNHSRTSSLELDHSAATAYHPYNALSLPAALTAILLSIGYPTLAILSLSATIFMYYIISTTDTPKRDMTLSFNALDDLTAANEVWESVVQDTVSFLESEESNPSSGLSSPSPLRVALHSCLQTTHTQCDNIRHLFSALTSPAELSQLSEMYAPPSPMKSAFTTETNSRPFSYPQTHLRSPSSPTTPENNKRSTWNGSYTSLASAGSPTNSVNRRREKQHRVNLSDVFKTGTSSAPVTPLPKSPKPAQALTEVPEDDIAEDLPSSTSSYFSPQYGHFGAAALELHRKRKSGGLEALRMPPPSYFTSDVQLRNRTPTISSSSKFTNPQPARHPLSYSALTYSLQGCLGAKRYTCSHLLALRFSDEEDEGYWEDVRSVMSLLISTLLDTSSRLSEALDEVEQQKLRDQHPTPQKVEFFDAEGTPAEGKSRRTVTSASKISFAPMPNHISRFAAHIAAISSALEDARDNLELCVEELKADADPADGSTTSNTAAISTTRKLRHSRSFSRPVFSPTTASGAVSGEAIEEEEPRALQAYERLRRELGLALRECERGRERLVEILHPPAIPSDDDEDLDDLPGLGHDGSDESEKPDPTSPSSEDEADHGDANGTVVNTSGTDEALPDDATSHLLLTSTAQHLPLPGIEEVFEADTANKTPFLRERSTLSREERIKIAKARRESGGKGLGLAVVGMGTGEEEGEASERQVVQEKWGPGGEVVQELKDVIWKVGERRRKMTDSVNSNRQLQPHAESPQELDLASNSAVRLVLAEESLETR